MSLSKLNGSTIDDELTLITNKYKLNPYELIQTERLIDLL